MAEAPGGKPTLAIPGKMAPDEKGGLGRNGRNHPTPLGTTILEWVSRAPGTSLVREVPWASAIDLNQWEVHVLN